MSSPPQRVVTGREEVCAVLADPRCLVPPAAAGAPAGTLAWLRAHVSRFSNGAEHDRGRAIVEAELARIDPAGLRRAARERACRRPDAARSAPVAVLASALGVPDAHLDAVAADVAAVAAAYFPGTARTSSWPTPPPPGWSAPWGPGRPARWSPTASACWSRRAPRRPR